MGAAVTAVAGVVEAWPDTVRDSCAQFFGTTLRAAQPALMPAARVLEIGCCEYDFLKQAEGVWPEMTFTGIDWRHYKRPGRASVIQGDVMAHAFAPDSFDWIVSISALEHVGLGHYNRDPQAEDGDVRALAKCWEWLAPGGWLYFDVPYNPARYEVVGSSHRIYDDAAITARLHQGRAWREHWRGAAKRGAESTLVRDPQPTRGGEDFYYIGFWWQKPGA